jgi:hypothetical protein
VRDEGGIPALSSERLLEAVREQYRLDWDGVHGYLRIAVVNLIPAGVALERLEVLDEPVWRNRWQQRRVKRPTRSKADELEA